MKRYSVAEVRTRLAQALDEAERGDSVSIERRGVMFELRRRAEPVRPGAGHKLFEVLDPAIDAGEWHWSAPGPAMKLISSRAKTKSSARARKKPRHG